MQAAQQWIEEHQGQLRDGGDAAESQGNPSEDVFDFLWGFPALINSNRKQHEATF